MGAGSRRVDTYHPQSGRIKLYGINDLPKKKILHAENLFAIINADGSVA